MCDPKPLPHERSVAIGRDYSDWDEILTVAARFVARGCSRLRRQQRIAATIRMREMVETVHPRQSADAL
ncbi:MAG: hypothetical protein ACREIF_11740 [Chthoniobacterales bacterium]